MAGLNAIIAGITQRLNAHKARHENGGADEINLDGLSGDPADTINESLLTTQNDVIVRGASIAERLAMAQSTILARLDAGNVVAATPAQLLALLSGDAGAAFAWNAQNLTGTGTIQSTNAVWWREHHYTIFSVSPGASGATEVAPDSSTLGGWQLTTSGHQLFYNCHVHGDWSADSDLEAHVIFEVNVNNTGGDVGDTVDLKLIARMKGDGETTVKIQTLEIATVVGQSAQYKQFEAIFLVNFDDGSNPLESGDLVTFELNLETDTSEVDDVIVNHVMCRYRTKKVQNEV